MEKCVSILVTLIHVIAGQSVRPSPGPCANSASMTVLYKQQMHSRVICLNTDLDKTKAKWKLLHGKRKEEKGKVMFPDSYCMYLIFVASHASATGTVLLFQYVLKWSFKVKTGTLHTY